MLMSQKRTNEKKKCPENITLILWWKINTTHKKQSIQTWTNMFGYILYIHVCLLLTTHCSLHTPCMMWKCRFFIVQCTHTRLYSVMFYSKDHVCSIMYFWPMIHKYLMCITILIKREKENKRTPCTTAVYLSTIIIKMIFCAFLFVYCTYTYNYT